MPEISLNDQGERLDGTLEPTWDLGVGDTVTLPVEALAKVVASADGGCFDCAGRLAEALAEIDPEHDWVRLVNIAGGWGTDD